MEPRIVEGRRSAGYYGVPRTENVAGALASQEFFQLPVVNELRPYAAAEKWVRAVNHHGGFGKWAFMVCTEPNRLGELLEAFGRARAA